MPEYNNNPQGGGNEENSSNKGNNNGNNGNNGGNNGANRGPNILAFIVVTMLALLFISWFVNRSATSAEELSYNEFITMVADGKVKV